MRHSPHSHLGAVPRTSLASIIDSVFRSDKAAPRPRRRPREVADDSTAGAQGCAQGSPNRGMEGGRLVMRYRARWRPALAGLLTAAWLSAGIPQQMPTASGQAEYVLYYSLDIPLAIPGLTLTDEGTKRTYVGALRRSLAGLPPAARDELVTAADRNPRLVRDYQQKTSSH